ncbi:GspH/FimT family pseudopilin [Pseudomonas psychrophila]|uniref:GspH/FimT family pseudopilin n=1 Tax=Pseudomonas psychrophila TaxID=122355 RepID=UPI000683E385|nr:GspH/FimT family pseudopilin [Pseudomonas psychrophila]
MNTSRENAVYQEGMSLIQLLFTLAIVAITAQFAGPAYSALIEQQRRQVTAEQLTNSLRTARTEALIRHQYVVVHALGEDWGKGWRIILDVSGKGHLDQSNPVLAERQGNTHIPIAGNTPVKHYVRFNPLGEPLLNAGAFQAGTLHICQAETTLSHYQVVLAKSGRISLRSDQAAQALCGLA